MTGVEFYNYLKSFYVENGQTLMETIHLKNGYKKKDSESFQFNLKNSSKSIPKKWLVDSKEAKNNGRVIDKNWFNNFYKEKNYNDCRARITIWLLNNH